MIDALLLTTALTLTNDRILSVEQPSRGDHSSIIKEASRVPAKWQKFTRCILARESGATLERIQSGVGARNPNSSASGRFQFLDRAWREGLAFMVRDRLIQFGMPKPQARQVREYLTRQPIYKWHGYWQQIGYVEVIERGGAHHWSGGSC